jgi:hypothetical protein
MNKVNRLKSLILCIGFGVSPLLLITIYWLGIYTALYDFLNDLSFLLDITNWRVLRYG